jgi:uncharacterized cupin superfamily protein
MDEAGRVFVSNVQPTTWDPDTDVGGQAHLLFQDPDGTTAGLWRSDPDDPPAPAEPVRIPRRETIVVLSGRVRVGVDDRDPLELETGDMASLPKGSMVAWDPSPDCKVFWVYS